MQAAASRGFLRHRPARPLGHPGETVFGAIIFQPSLRCLPGVIWPIAGKGRQAKNAPVATADKPLTGRRASAQQWQCGTNRIPPHPYPPGLHKGGFLVMKRCSVLNRSRPDRRGPAGKCRGNHREVRSSAAPATSGPPLFRQRRDDRRQERRHGLEGSRRAPSTGRSSTACLVVASSMPATPSAWSRPARPRRC